MAEDTGYGPADVDPMHQSIATALTFGYRPDEILEKLKSSNDPMHQEWYKKYSEINKEAEKAPVVLVKESINNPPSNVSTPLLSKLHNLSNYFSFS